MLGGSKHERERSASGQIVAGAFPRYEAAATGFSEYWYPVAFSRDVTAKPRPLTILAQTIVLVRDGGRVYALHDRCPHRGIPLSAGHQVAPGTLSCPYHGWTYDLSTGLLVAALSDAPDSAICGKVTVKTYPVEERLGLVWVYVGEGQPPPVEHDIPAELLRPHATLLGISGVRPGNWRYAMENAVDEAHARYLHRTAVWAALREMPAWTRFDIGLSQEGPGAPWVERSATKVVFQDRYPVVGLWPPRAWWQRHRAKVRVSARLPCTLRIEGESWASVYHFCVPVDDQRYLRISTLVRWVHGPQALTFRLWYWLWARWARLGQFIGQDQWMVELMQIPPERLFGPDKAITFWRRYCDERARTPMPTARASAAARQSVPAR
jgi:phenylpropionate dioxygenase-like ring-hydroxylating dioxygenase large terminal subunit